MTNPLIVSPWYRLANPVASLRPPAQGSYPEQSPYPELVINDDWRETGERACIIALARPDGTGMEVIPLQPPVKPGDEYLVFLGYPNRLWIKPLHGLPGIGTWRPEDPTTAMREAEARGAVIDQRSV